MDERKQLEEACAKLKRYLFSALFHIHEMALRALWFFTPEDSLTNNTVLYFSASAVDDLQMKELQDQLEAETYFSVKLTSFSLT